MSDRIADISRSYEEAFGFPNHPRSIGLFKIPEYPEFESGDGGMWSTALDAIFTALRYLAPATLLTLFWGQQSFLFRILRHIDLAVRTIVFSSDKQKESVLKWLEQAGPVRVEHLDTVWRHGWILCGVLDTAMPGACAGHPPIRMSLKHAQTIADHYLGVEPVFTRDELENNDCLSRHQEWKLAHYLDRIREALTKIPPPVSKPNSQRTSPDGSQFTLDYVARGGGLTAAQVNHKMFFKIYPTTQQSLEPGDITILIKGPKDTYGMIVIPPILGKAQMIRQKMLNLNKEPQFTENTLPITQGATYLRSFGKNDLKKAYYIPKTKYDIEIEVDKSPNHAKIGYLVTMEGKYEISISSRGKFIIGSPFLITASCNILGTLEKDSFCLEDGEEIDIVDEDGDKKVVLRIVDFVTEKMLLNDSGPLDQITTNDSKRSIDNKHVTTQTKTDFSEVKIYDTADKFNDKFNKNRLKKTAMKVRAMTRACKVFQHSLAEAKLKAKNKEKKINTRSQLGIPDVVNSTLTDTYVNPYKAGKHDISTSEKVPLSQSLKRSQFHESRDRYESVFFSTSEEKESFSSAINDTVLSTSNPFLSQIEDHCDYPEKVSDPHFTTHNYVEDSDDGEETPIKIMIDKEDTPTNVSPNTNPFIDVEMLERPKTPVLKILTGEVKDRADSVYIDPNFERITEEILRNNEFINPFFMHQHRRDSEEHVTDFIIGAPVSLPPLVKAPTPEPEMDSIMVTCEQQLYSVEVKTDDIPTSVFSTPMHTKLDKIDSSIPSSIFHSLDSNLNSTDANSNESFNLATKRDTWDSAYVSIDESNSSPDGNNNDNALNPPETPNLIPEDFSNLGPAEIEMWESCNELSDIPKMNEDIRSSKWEIRRPIFTPILEESDRSISAGLKDLHDLERQPSEQDPVTVAFAELNDVFHEYLSPSEQSSLNAFQDDMSTSTEINYNVVRNDDCVDSASECTSDVMRQTKMKLEGVISAIQSIATESVSASQNLQAKQDDTEKPKTHFGDDPLTNIVLEKKQFWDEKIRTVQIEEIKTEQRKKRLSSKHLRHNDSLTKRRGKQLVKSYQVSISENTTPSKSSSRSPDENKSPELEEPDITDAMHEDGKLVQNWKKYWDNRLETEQEETQVTCFRVKSPKTKDRYHSPSPCKLEEIKEDVSLTTALGDSKATLTASVKQDVPEEIMFKAFEESPKRFFGSSRKQILNKIDAFLGKPNTADENIAVEESGARQERGIVSSRINLFRNISNVEEAPWQRNKSSSMQNIRMRSDSESNNNQSFLDEMKDRFATGKVQSYIDLSSDKSNQIAEPTNPIKHYSKTKIHADIASVKDKQYEMPNQEIKKHAVIACNVTDQDTTPKTISIKEKSTEVAENVRKPPKVLSLPPEENIVKKTISQINRQSSARYQPSKTFGLKKSSVSKSEMDIFTKINSSKDDDDDLDKYKSYDELPKINVKNFISLYETVSKTTHAEPKVTPKRISRTNSATSEKLVQSFSSITGAETKAEVIIHIPRVEETIANLTQDKNESIEDVPQAPPRRKRNKTSSQESLNSQSMESLNDKNLPEKDHEKVNEDHQEERAFLSFSDIEVEIIDKSPDCNRESTPEVNIDTDYKSRFKMAKQYFQSLEELRPEDKKPKVNECEQLLLESTVKTPVENPVNESSESERPNRRLKKNLKAFSLPSTELSELIWDQMTESEPNKLVKISEKFNVDDLFNDVVEGKLSRQGSLRGIPNKKAVLETFKSMENVSDTNMSPYEIAVDQLTAFAKENKIKNAQTYLTEYPFLPTTDPSKYHSRLDTKAIGLISMKELQEKKRRNSVPELTVNPRFTVDL